MCVSNRLTIAQIHIFYHNLILFYKLIFAESIKGWPGLMCFTISITSDSNKDKKDLYIQIKYQFTLYWHRKIQPQPHHILLYIMYIHILD